MSTNTLEVVHDEETARNLSLGSLSLAALLAVGDGRVPDGFVEETAKGAEALKSHLKTNIGDSEVPRA